MKKKKKLKERMKSYWDFKLKYMDHVTVTLVLLLFGTGLLAIYSVTLTASTGFNNPNFLSGWGPEDYFMNQAQGGIIGIIGMFIVMLLPHGFLRKFGGPAAIIVTLGLLFATAFFGVTGGGADSIARRWLSIGGRRFQPGEFARLGLIYSVSWLVYHFTAKKTYALRFTDKFRNFLISQKVPFRAKWKYIKGSYGAVIFFVALVSVLFAAQPDLGSAIIVFGVGIVMVLSSGLPPKHIGFLMGLGVLGLGAIALFVMAGGLELYQMERFAIWQDPFNHPNGLQNYFGFRSFAIGGLFGVGLGEGPQRFGFAIEAHTDFIITVLAEELGLIAVLLVMAAYFAIAMRCFLTAFKGQDLFSSMFCIGTGALLLIQPIINLGGVSGLIPLTGVTLPLLSFGSTSAVAIFLMIGVYLNARIEIMKDNLAVKKKPKKMPADKIISFPKAS